MGLVYPNVFPVRSPEGSDRALDAGSNHADDGGGTSCCSESGVGCLPPFTCLPLTTTGGIGRVGGGSLGGTFSRDL